MWGVVEANSRRSFRQTWLVNKLEKPKLNRRQRLQKWLVGRTHLEHVLGALSGGLLTLVVVLLVALRGESAPLETVWGNVAEWAGVVVTFFGFVGAIAALRIQSRSVEIQDEQRRAQVREKADADFVKQVQGKAIVTRLLAQKTNRLREERERYARSVEFEVKAEHQRPDPGHQIANDGQLALSVKARFHESKEPVPLGPYKDNRLMIPGRSELLGMEESIARVFEENLGASGFRNDLIWRVTGDSQFRGDDIEALKWLIPRVGVEFTDPKGIRWRINGDKTLDELAVGGSPLTL